MEPTPISSPIPSATVHAELSRALGEADTQLGLVFQGIQANESNKQMVENKRVANSGALATKRSTINVIFGRGYPNGPAISRMALSSIRQLEKNNPWFSWETKQWLAPIKATLQSNIDNPDSKAIDEEVSELDKISNTLETELAKLGGIYVYTYSHYIRYPYDVESQKTLYKVGKSDRNPKVRVLEQARSTSTPEDPVIVRVYTVPEGSLDTQTPKQMEEKYHTLLRAAKHTRPAVLLSNREWFLTDLDFLDAIAEVLGYRVSESLW